MKTILSAAIVMFVQFSAFQASLAQSGASQTWPGGAWGPAPGTKGTAAGTQTWPGGAWGPAPGSQGQTAVPSPYYPGAYYLRNQPGVGYYSQSPFWGGYPQFGLPQPVGGGYFSFQSGSTRFNLWKAPSGYYYPWANRGYYAGYVPPVVVVEQGSSIASKPPIMTVMMDLRKFLDEAKSNNRMSESDYNHLSQRLKDLAGKEGMLRNSAGGTLDPALEDDIRKDLDQLGSEIQYRIK